MKRLVLLVLLAAMAFCGCTVVREETQTNQYSEVLLMQEVDLEPNIAINPVLYFLNAAGTKLGAESREIALPQSGIPEKFVVQALIDGPISEELSPVANGFMLTDMEIMPDLINVYLSLETYKSEKEITNAKIAIASTLVDYSGKKYVNVMINNQQIGFMETPTGALRKIKTDLSEEYISLEQKAQAQSPDMYAVLYYLDSSESFLMPETRRLVFKDRDYITTLVEQLIRGPEDTYSHMPVLDNSVKLIGAPQIAETGDGQKIVQLNFNKEPVVYTENFVDGRERALAALTYTIVDFMPDISGVEIYVNGQQLNSKVYYPVDFKDLIGSDILLYLPTSTYTLLTGVERVISQNIAGYPYTLLKELMKGPTAFDTKELYPAFPTGIDMHIVNEIYIANDVMVVDFDASIYEKMKDISKDGEYMMIFSMVNTLTSFEGIRWVQFLVEGERVEYLGEGAINVMDPILKNPGIIRY